MPTNDVITVITKFGSQALFKNGESRVVALDIPKAFGRVWRADLLSGRIFYIIQLSLNKSCNESRIDIRGLYP